MTRRSRPDGRRADELRPIDVELGFQDWAEGSVLFSLGRTQVLVAASVHEDAPRWLRGTGRGWVTGRVRDAARGRPTERTAAR